VARVERSDGWTAPGGIAEVQAKVEDYLTSTAARITGKRDGTTDFSQGSQAKTRLLGGWFISAASFPKRGSVTLAEATDGVRVEARLEESLGVGWLDPAMRRKYEEYFAEYLAGLRRAIGG
jgi:hypothetical protein